MWFYNTFLLIYRPISVCEKLRTHPSPNPATVKRLQEVAQLPRSGSVPLHSNLLEPNQDKEHPLSLQRRKDSIQDHPNVNRKKMSFTNFT